MTTTIVTFEHTAVVVDERARGVYVEVQGLPLPYIFSNDPYYQRWVPFCGESYGFMNWRRRPFADALRLHIQRAIEKASRVSVEIAMAKEVIRTTKVEHEAVSIVEQFLAAPRPTELATHA
jgi:hypothetical protein